MHRQFNGWMFVKNGILLLHNTSTFNSDLKGSALEYLLGRSLFYYNKCTVYERNDVRVTYNYI